MNQYIYCNIYCMSDNNENISLNLDPTKISSNPKSTQIFKLTHQNPINITV